MTFTLTYRNDGNVAVHDAALSEVVPSGSVFVASADAWSCAAGDPAGTTCTLAVGDLDPGDNGSATFVVTVDSPLADPTQASLPNTAVIDGMAQDPTGEVEITVTASAAPTIESTHLSGVVYLIDPAGGPDTPLAGATVALLDGSGTPILNPATSLPWEVTVGADGAYEFGGLAAGTYTVVETTPLGYGNAPGHSASATVTVPLGGAEQDFWHTLASIGGVVFVDANLDGAFTIGEPPLVGVTVALDGTNVHGDAVHLTTMTAADGSYEFLGLLEGTYTVTESQPTSWANGPTIVGSSGGTSSGTDDAVADIALPAGTDAIGYDFGEIGTPVSGSVFIDTTGTPIPGTLITLTGTDVFGNPVTVTATTDTDGDYEFTNVWPGDYSVLETQPLGLVSGLVAPTDVRTITVAGSPVTDQDFSEQAATLSGTVTESIDGTGVPAVGDPAIAGVTVTLTGADVNGSPVSLTTTTDASGNYSFVDLIAGTYTVTETQPTGYGNGATLPGSEGGASTGDDDMVGAVVLPAGAAAVDYDFNETTAPISGSVWVQGSLEPLAGVELTLLAPDGSVVATTTTDAAGDYEFPNVVAGDYTIVESQPTGYDSATPNELPVTHGTTPTTDVDYVETTATVSGSVWVDHSGDPLEGVIVRLVGSDVNGNPVERSTVTDAYGDYEFEGVLAGTYTIEQTQPDDHVGGAVEPDNVIPVTVQAGSDLPDNSFSERQATSVISGTVYEDGTTDPIPGTTVDLLDHTGEVIDTTTTGPAGTYTFGGLPEGTYTVVEHQPDGYVDGAVGTDNTIDVALGPDDSEEGVDFSERIPPVRPRTPPQIEWTGSVDLPPPPTSSGPSATPESPETPAGGTSAETEQPAPPPSLAFSGSSTLAVLSIALSAMLTGGALVLGTTRRRED